jgi:NTE family protein
VAGALAHAAGIGAQGPADYRQRLYRAQINEYLDASARPYIHLVDGGLADNLGVQRLLDRALMSGGLRQTFREVAIPPGSVRKVVLVVVNAERDPTRNLDLSDEVPGIFDVADALLFGTGARATNETQEFLHDVARAWHRRCRGRARRPRATCLRAMPRSTSSPSTCATRRAAAPSGCCRCRRRSRLPTRR